MIQVIDTYLLIISTSKHFTTLNSKDANSQLYTVAMFVIVMIKTLL
jgi:hypothetical protein